MVKLKCWKKVSKDFWKKYTSGSKFSHSVRITKNIENNYVVRSPHSFSPKLRNFKDKSNAMSYANKYMKEHNKC